MMLDMDDMQLTDLPQDVLLHVALFLGYNELVALSATCKFLRSALNVDCVWRRVASGDSSVLEKWKDLSESSENDPDPLPSLCHQRILCLRRAQMVNSIREQRFHKKTTRLTEDLILFEPPQLVINHLCTYKGMHLFALKYDENKRYFQIIVITELGELPVTPEVNCVSLSDIGYFRTCEVIRDKLVVRIDNLIHVYQISSDCVTVSPLQTINTCHGSLESVEHLVYIVGSAIFSEHDVTKRVHVWDVHSNQSFGELVSSKEGSYLTIIGHSTELKAVLFYLESRERAEAGYILQYSTAMVGFTDFSVTIEKQNGLIIPLMIGLVNEKYNVVLIPHSNAYTISVSVYDRTSALVCEKQFEDLDFISWCDNDYFFSVKDCLALNSLKSIKIVLLSNLEIVWEIFFDQVFPCPVRRLLKLPISRHAKFNRVVCRYLNIANTLHLLILSTRDCVSIWDFELRRKLFELPQLCHSICVDDAFTKLIFKVGGKELAVWSFGKIQNTI